MKPKIKVKKFYYARTTSWRDKQGQLFSKVEFCERWGIIVPKVPHGNGRGPIGNEREFAYTLVNGGLISPVDGQNLYQPTKKLALQRLKEILESECARCAKTIEYHNAELKVIAGKGKPVKMKEPT